MSDQSQLVTFSLGEEQYAINIMDVKEIVRVQEIRAIPNAPTYVEGIFNLRGEIIPIINLHKRFHLKKIISVDEELLSGFVIIEIDNMKLGVIIDRVSRVVSIEKENIQPPPQMLTGIGAEYIHGVVRQEEGGYLIILNIRDLFNPRELQKIVELRR